jgi:hypothetical protein
MSFDGNFQEPVKGQFSFFLIQLASTFITAIFLAIWVAVQYGVNRFVQWLQPVDIDQIVLWVFQGIFAITTLIPVGVYYYVDTRVILIRARRRIEQEERGETA